MPVRGCLIGQVPFVAGVVRAVYEESEGRPFVLGWRTGGNSGPQSLCLYSAAARGVARRGRHLPDALRSFSRSASTFSKSGILRRESRSVSLRMWAALR